MLLRRVERPREALKYQVGTQEEEEVEVTMADVLCLWLCFPSRFEMQKPHGSTQ